MATIHISAARDRREPRPSRLLVYAALLLTFFAPALPAQTTPIPDEIVTVGLSIEVDRHGDPTKVTVTHSAGKPYDGKAIAAAWKRTFAPHIENGKQVPFHTDIEIKFDAAKVKTVPPVVVEAPKPRWPRSHVGSTPHGDDALFGLTVNVTGQPENVHLLRSCGDDAFDNAALEAVQRYRFRPATKEGVPVAFLMNVDVNVP